ncbi:MULTISPECIES: tRNA (adenosine(37)-N6)-threonylcarbamoyltransferase complex ATPase subunit type 1 TsaE [Thalassospira]|uniref:tRNA threonylcarbamoyladenosine biosynthesis protein TsaE n=2 Tax=Thalassospira TaxID=168934 RepID=A0A367W0V7_9PROT|nr:MULTISPECIES: tRNA (adenosine(37)-N6)-threonylcarbamoyltransferase complex ATPase subunit type 1 TsaE [Thalassospira]MDG4721328.1 tRNA (adenosine(37)-N6)-threonylcarbamoyltransferase complex ATPase subunit type 1 TsaE [Thalassospira sp. FZY0004]RCK32935.1 ATP/GTP hydrolase [Thalassospira profundimaris]
MTKTVTVSNQTGTEALAAQLAAIAKPGDVILMHGTLGMGKSAFCRAFIRAVADNPHEEVPSPTFTLVQIYELDRLPVWHFDLYRLSDPEEIDELDIEDAFADAVSLIEWPDRLEYLTPENRLDIHIEPGPTADGRVFVLEPSGEDWVKRIDQFAGDPV